MEPKVSIVVVCSAVETVGRACLYYGYILAMSSDNASSAVTYTSISSDSDRPSWGIPLMNVVYVLEPKHPKYHVPSYDDMQSMEKDSIDYPDEPEDPEEDHTDYPADGGDGDDEPSDDDDDDNTEDKDDEPTEDEDDDEEEEEHLALALLRIPFSQTCLRKARKTIRLEPPMSTSMEARIVEHAAAPIPPTSLAYDQAPLGHRATMIRMRDGILKEDMPSQRRFILTAPLPRGDVVKSSAAAARPPRGQYDFVKTVKAGQSLIRSPDHDAQTIARAADRAYDVRRQESEDFYKQLYDAGTDRRDIRLEIDVGTEGIVGLSQWLEKMESLFHISGCTIDNQVKFATYTLLGAALTSWNGHVRTLGHDAAYDMTWGTLKKKLTDKYCPKGEIKKLKIKLWNLKVRGNDVEAYTQRFQELALMCTKFLADETKKVDKYISGLPDNIHGNVMSARPKTLDDAIELANDLIDQKLRTYAERKNDNKRKADDSSRNN
nr:reverse transcriptase domain-containing protein [Tanacetum cinerariifolium]